MDFTRVLTTIPSVPPTPSSLVAQRPSTLQVKASRTEDSSATTIDAKTTTIDAKIPDLSTTSESNGASGALVGHHHQRENSIISSSSDQGRKASSSPSRNLSVGQLYESLANSIRTPLDSLRRRTKSKLKSLKINSNGNSPSSSAPPTPVNSPSSANGVHSTSEPPVWPTSSSPEQESITSNISQTLAQSLLNRLKSNSFSCSSNGSTTTSSSNGNHKVQSSEPSLASLTSISSVKSAAVDKSASDKSPSVKSRSSSLNNCDSISISRLILEPPSAFASRCSTPYSSTRTTPPTLSSVTHVPPPPPPPTPPPPEPEDLYLEHLNQNVIKRPKVVAKYSPHGRIFYLNQDTKVTSWLPPIDSWSTFQPSPVPVSAVPSTSNGVVNGQSSASSRHTPTPTSQLNNLCCSSNSNSSGENGVVVNGFSTDISTASGLSPSQAVLPYGWEPAIDKDGQPYFINHSSCSTTYQFPAKTWEEEPPPEPRTVVIKRNHEQGFGFIIGSEKPSVIRAVTQQGPSDGLLQREDLILEINNESVLQSSRNHVVELISKTRGELTLTVCQPYYNNTLRKSALLTSAKKARLKDNPTRVRFASGVMVNGSPLYPTMASPEPDDDGTSGTNGDGTDGANETTTEDNNSEVTIPFIPNVLKVFLENGQTKTFKYDSNTTVQTVLDSLFEKLSIKCGHLYGLVSEQIRTTKRSKLTLLDPSESLANIAARPNAHNIRCLFRVVIYLPDPLDLLHLDLVTFEYLYAQCCNDIVFERYQPEIKYEVAFRLAALRIQEYATLNPLYLDPKGKVNLKKVDIGAGLDHFLPVTLAETMKRKEMIRVLTHSLKLNAANLQVPGKKGPIQPLHARVQFMKILSDLPSYGGKIFTNNTTRHPSPKVNAANVANVPSTSSSSTGGPGGGGGNARNESAGSSPAGTSQRSGHSGHSYEIVHNHPEIILLCPKYGLCYIYNLPVKPNTLVRLEDVTMVKVAKNEDNPNQFNIEVYGIPWNNGANAMRQLHPSTDKSLKEKSFKAPIMCLTLDTYEAQEFVLLIKGYHRLVEEVDEGQRVSGTSRTRPASPIQIIWESPTDEWWNDGAPRYYGTHTVFGSGWNYPPPPQHINGGYLVAAHPGIDQPGPSTSGGTIVSCHEVDLAIAPPHFSQAMSLRAYPQSGAHKAKTSLLNLSGLTEVVKSLDSRDSQLYIMETDKLMDQQRHNQANHVNASTNGNGRPTSIDVPSLVSMEILESHGRASNVDHNEVAFRVAEMNRILKDAERYLFEYSADSLDRSPQYGFMENMDNVKQTSKTIEVSIDEHSPNTSGVIQCQVTGGGLMIRDRNTPPKSPHDPNQRNSSSFGIQTGSRISTLDMFPQLLQAESELLEIVKTLNTNSGSGTPQAVDTPPPIIVTSSDQQQQHGSQSPLRLSRLIASLEACGQSTGQLEMIDLTALPPPRTPEKEQPESYHSNDSQVVTYTAKLGSKLNRELSPPASYRCPPIPEGEELQLHPIKKRTKENPSARVVAELDSLCDTLYEMKSTHGSLTPEKQNSAQNSLTKANNNSNNSLLSTFDQLTASINRLLIQETGTFGSSPSAANSGNNPEFFNNLVIPPPPPESPTLVKEQDDVIQRFWRATDDVRRIVTTRQQQQQQLAFQSGFISGYVQAGPSAQVPLLDPPPYPVNGGNGMSSDSTMMNTSSDSESDLACGYHNQHRHYQHDPNYRHNSASPKSGTGNGSRQYTSIPNLNRPSRLELYNSGQPNGHNGLSSPQASPPLHPSQQDAYYRELAKQLIASQQQQQHGTNVAIAQLLATQRPDLIHALHPLQMDQLAGNSPRTTPPTPPLQGASNTGNTNQPVVRKLSNPQQMVIADAQLQALLNHQQQQQQQQQAMHQASGQFGKSKLCSGPEVSGGLTNVYSNPFPQQTPLFQVQLQQQPPPLQPQQSVHFQQQMAHPMAQPQGPQFQTPPSPHMHHQPGSYPNLQQMLLNYHQHQSGLQGLMDPRASSQQGNSCAPMNRSQSLTLLPTNHASPVNNIHGHHITPGVPGSSSTPPPVFPPMTAHNTMDINNLLGQLMQPQPQGMQLTQQQQQAMQVNASNNSPTIMTTTVSVMPNTGRLSPRFPKPPIPPNSPSIKEKRRQQAIMKSNSFNNKSDKPTPPDYHLVNQFGNGGSSGGSGPGYPPHPPPPYNSAHHQHNLPPPQYPNSTGSSSSGGSNASFSPELTSLLGSSGQAYKQKHDAQGQAYSSVSSPPVYPPQYNKSASPSREHTQQTQQQAHQSPPTSSSSPQIGQHHHHPKDQYFLGSTVLVDPNGGNTVGPTFGNGALDPRNSAIYASIPESKRICFQTKEMEEIFAQSQYDIDTLLVRLEDVHESRLSSSHSKSKTQDPNGAEPAPTSPSSAKETLIVESRHFVTASKFFVKCATEGSFQLIDYLTECVTLLERMFHASETVIFEMESHAQITCLVDRLKEVAATYAYTVDTVRRLVGYTPTVASGEVEGEEAAIEGVVHPNKNPYMDLLMNHATSLATSLSTLMRTLRTMN